MYTVWLRCNCLAGKCVFGVFLLLDMRRHYPNPSQTPNDQKLRELILFVSERSEGDASFGSVKLNKLLFYADFLAYLEFGRAITWQKYQKLENGPCPRRMLPILHDLENDQDIAVVDRKYHGYTQKRTVALREPDLSMFSADEIGLVTQLIDEFWGKNAAQISDASHDFVGWRLANIGEDIPYEAALAKFADQASAPKLSSRFKKELLKRDDELRTH